MISMPAGVIYSPEQQTAIDYDGGHLQIIASAGSGKTETISRRCATLLKKGVKPEEIIAFTFTDKAAEELRSRIEKHVVELLGQEFQKNKLNVRRNNTCVLSKIPSTQCSGL